MARSTRLFRVCLFALCALSPIVAPAQPTQGKVERVKALGPALHLQFLPRCLQLMENHLQMHFPDVMVKGIGTGAKLGPGWRPGDPSYEKAVQLIERTVRKEEASQGKPLIQMDFGKVAPFVAENMSEGEISTFSRMLNSEFGRAIVRVADAGAVSEFDMQMERLGAISPEVRTQIDEIKREAKKVFTDTVLKMSALEAKYPKEAAEFKTFSKRLDGDVGKRLGEMLINDSMARAAGLVFDIMPELRQIVKTYREANPPTE